MTEEENFEEYKQMMLKICNDPRKLCTWEHKKFNLDKYLRKTINEERNDSGVICFPVSRV